MKTTAEEGYVNLNYKKWCLESGLPLLPDQMAIHPINDGTEDKLKPLFSFRDKSNFKEVEYIETRIVKRSGI